MTKIIFEDISLEDLEYAIEAVRFAFSDKMEKREDIVYITHRLGMFFGQYMFHVKKNKLSVVIKEKK